MDPAGKILIAASVAPVPMREGAGIKMLPAGLSVFRIGSDGKLEFARKYDLDASMQHYKAGETYPMLVARHDKLVTLSLTFGAKPYHYAVELDPNASADARRRPDRSLPGPATRAPWR